MPGVNVRCYDGNAVRMNRRKNLKHARILESAVFSHRNKDYKKAAEGYAQVLSVDPKNVDALRLLGTIALESGNVQTGFDLISKAVGFYPKNAAARADLDRVLMAKGDNEGDVEQYKKACERNPANHNFVNDL